MNGRQLVLIGGGHAHLDTITRIPSFTKNQIDITVIQPSEHHYYSGMGPGILGTHYRAEETKFFTKQMVESRGGTFITDTVTRIDPVLQQLTLQNNAFRISYDVLSCNIGSRVADDIVQPDSKYIFAVKPIENLQKLKETILEAGKSKPLRIAIVGGGPSAVEVAGNIHQLGTSKQIHSPEITIFASRDLLPSAPLKVRQLALSSFEKRGINYLTNCRATGVSGNKIYFQSQSPYSADLIVSAVGLRCSTLFKNSKLAVSSSDELLVNTYLQHIDYPTIFGGGDCINYTPTPLDKAGVYAVRQGPVLAKNLLASFSGQSLTPFNPGGTYLMIYNLGNLTGIYHKAPLIFNGRIAFFIKNLIDRRFMNKFKR